MSSSSAAGAPNPTAIHQENLARLFKPGPYHLTMGLRRLDAENWLTVDEHYYRPEHTMRAGLLNFEKNAVLQCLPGSEAACQETLETVVKFLTKTYPKFFEFYGGGEEYVYNKLAEELVRVAPPYDKDHTGAEMGPLEVAARLAMEDFNILIKGGADKDCHHLKASATLYPAGWFLQERIGWPVAELHNPVPLWKDKVAVSVERYFSRINETSPMERSNFFVQATMTLFHPFVFQSFSAEPLLVENIVIRHERQTLRRLPKSGAVLFTVRTYMDKLQELSADQLAKFAAVVRAWPEGVAKYKGRAMWGDVVLKYCDEKAK